MGHEPPPPLRGHSLWLLPVEQEPALSLIRELARTHGTASFLPHVTVLGESAHPVEALRGAAAIQARRTAPLTLRGQDLRVGASWFRRLHLGIEESGPLVRLRSELLEALPAPSPGIYMPHMSLAYGMALETARSERDRLRGCWQGRALLFGTLSLWRTAGPAASWASLGSWPLEGVPGSRA